MLGLAAAPSIKSVRFNKRTKRTEGAVRPFQHAFHGPYPFFCLSPHDGRLVTKMVHQMPLKNEIDDCSRGTYSSVTKFFDRLMATTSQTTKPWQCLQCVLVLVKMPAATTSNRPRVVRNASLAAMVRWIIRNRNGTN